MDEPELGMDHPVAYDMVIAHMDVVQRDRDLGRSPQCEAARMEWRHHYAIINAAKSNEEGTRWGLSL